MQAWQAGPVVGASTRVADIVIPFESWSVFDCFMVMVKQSFVQADVLEEKSGVVVFFRRRGCKLGNPEQEMMCHVESGPKKYLVGRVLGGVLQTRFKATQEGRGDRQVLVGLGLVESSGSYEDLSDPWVAGRDRAVSVRCVSG